ncbi:MAG: hypothetical protein ABI533_06595 [Betaproteobacteria bacterium]
MKSLTGLGRTLATLLGSALLGAVAMYSLDPDKGSRRRARSRQRAARMLVRARRALRATVRDMRHRYHGLRFRARHVLDLRTTAEDLILIERVRARMGRVVSHPHALQVGARAGKITLSGLVLSSEAAPLLAAARAVWGVRSVDDSLVRHATADTVPRLRGTRARPPDHDRWPPALRAAALIAGGSLVARALHRRSPSRTLIGLLGAALVVRAAGNHALADVIDPRRRRSAPMSARGLTDTAASPATWPARRVRALR